MNTQSHQLSMTVLMTPDMANFSGNVHGGHILKFLDQVAYACASRYAGRYVVTLSVDQVVFRQPVHVGELVTFLASVNYTGTTSMEIGIKVITENIRERSVRHHLAALAVALALPVTLFVGVLLWRFADAERARLEAQAASVAHAAAHACADDVLRLVYLALDDRVRIDVERRVCAVWARGARGCGCGREDGDYGDR